MYLLYSKKLIPLLLSSSLLFIEVNDFYGLQFLLMPGLLIQMILIKITQECTSLLWLRNTKILNGAKRFKNLLKSQDISYISIRTWMIKILILKAPKYIFVREKCKDLPTGIHINLLKSVFLLVIFVGLCRNRCVYVRSSDTSDSHSSDTSLARMC